MFGRAINAGDYLVVFTTNVRYSRLRFSRKGRFAVKEAEREQLIVQYLPLVRSVARRFVICMPAENADDIVGVMSAVNVPA